MRSKPVFLIVMAAAAGCTFDGSGTSLPEGNDDDGPVVGEGPDAGVDDPPGDDPVPVEPDAAPPQVVLCRVDGPDLGVDGLEVAFDAETVAFVEWQPKPDKPNDYVGFVLSDNAEDVDYRVTAGTKSYTGSGTTWTHPDLDEGNVPKISRIEFCDIGGGGGPGPGGDDDD